MPCSNVLAEGCDVRNRSYVERSQEIQTLEPAIRGSVDRLAVVDGHGAVLLGSVDLDLDV